MTERIQELGQWASQPAPGGIKVEVSEAEGVFFLGLVALFLVVVLGVVVIRLSGRRSA
ncbi:MAG TPA: hypothetical protein VER79_06355 [Candidatus Limnocylindrales bacterium]|nr:hypothetical protein [Candidatus Limnocylindrales bacterium]